MSASSTPNVPVAVVTGASSGIGRATATALARRGSGVVVTYNRNPDGAHEVVREIADLGGTAVALELDIARPESFSAFRDQVGETLSEHWRTDRLTALVNNAGVGGVPLMFADTTEEQFDAFMQVNLRGPYFLTQALLPLLADGGAIVNVTSNATGAGLTAGYSAYAISKGGMATLTRYLAKELSPRGIRVNAVSPGVTRTRLGGDAFAKHPEMIPAIAEHTALGRIGEPEDVGMMIAALASEEGRWVTAQEIEVSGGYNF
ncbi:NAD(P)-dependent dehydrogenase, short-chain alcohol dehydrogenase family [Nocardioides sp. YR527]|uniref:SDR family NAD(P)-dependent oxidoreductase n=1 Tax=Nocardioides sp. YR527 TaxID=1881028 RepID=UPI000888B9EC|nr:SDR family oxidoreductase [Nocardioides sp. YR527]SDJ78704.1 NAD(P)-dependent dehydrogenase, short-chain alcohol dehydrogenase family [Nocardioides sp. YR527]